MAANPYISIRYENMALPRGLEPLFSPWERDKTIFLGFCWTEWVGYNSFKNNIYRYLVCHPVRPCLSPTFPYNFRIRNFAATRRKLNPKFHSPRRNQSEANGSHIKKRETGYPLRALWARDASWTILDSHLGRLCCRLSKRVEGRELDCPNAWWWRAAALRSGMRHG